MWQQSAHARAHRSLSPAQLGDSRCSSCHSLMPDAADARFAGVQCESCHGGGKYYQPAYVMKDRELGRAVGLLDANAGQCVQCHTAGAPSIAPFDFKAAWAQIDHSRAAEIVWERARTAAAP